MSRKVGVAEVITVLVIVATCIVWAIRLEGQLYAQEGKLSAQEQTITEIKAQHAADLKQFRDDLTYIRGRIDSALESGRR